MGRYDDLDIRLDQLTTNQFANCEETVIYRRENFGSAGGLETNLCRSWDYRKGVEQSRRTGAATMKRGANRSISLTSLQAKRVGE